MRDYQRDMLDRLQTEWGRHRSVMVQMPTGTGKTVLMAEVVKEVKSEGVKSEKWKVDGNGGVLVVAHRRELIEQIRQTLGAFGIENGGPRVVVESIQKISRAEANFSLLTSHFSLIIIDEAHHALAKTYRMLWEWWPQAKFLGLTATPCRLNGAPFTDLFDTLLQSWDIQRFIDKGWLSDFEYVSAAPESLMMRQVGQLQKRGADGDYQTKEMVTVMDVPESIRHLFDTYKAYAWGKKGIVYAIDRQHAQHIAAYYQAHGVKCAVIDSRTPAGERDRIVEAYKNNEAVDVIVNVDIFSEGFDCPEVEFIQLARPTLSLCKYLQQVGRGMRVSKGKSHVLILDQVGLYQTFGLPTDDRDWHLTFLGKVAGKGDPDKEPILIVDDEFGIANPERLSMGKEQRALVNLEMVRIKRRGESNRGVEVYLQGGKYGVMNDGKVTCPPQFIHISKINHGSGYFAIGTYPYAIFHNKQTVIDNQGMDLKASLYGEVTQEGDFFRANDSRGDTIYFDGIGRTVYKAKPKTMTFHHVDLIAKDNGRLMLRRLAAGLMAFDFRKDEILYNDAIVIVRDRLMVKGDKEHIYQVFGYLDNSVLAATNWKKNGFLQIFYDGRLGSRYEKIPDGLKLGPNYQALHLRRAQ